MGVARLVTAGVGARLDLPFEAVDDLQLAVELVLAAAFAEEGRHATIGFANDGASLTISVSPLDDGVLAATRAPTTAKSACGSASFWNDSSTRS